MSLRSASQTGIYGYGVFGDIYDLRTDLIPGTSSVLLDLRTALADIPKVPGLQTPSFRIVEMSWRFSADIVVVDDESLKKYDVTSGKSRFGSWVARAYNYTTLDGFISYDRMLSPSFSCAFLLTAEGDSEDEDYIPCSEPQQDIPELYLQTDNLFAYNSPAVFPLSGPFEPDAIADMAELYFDVSVLTVRVGVTYAFQSIVLPASTVIDTGIPRIVVL
jgi:hypothetical protein